MPLSYSAYAAWDRCPAKYKYAYIERLPRGEPGPAVQRGNDVHKSIDEFLLGQRGTLHHEIGSYKEWLASLKDHKLYPEERWAVDEQWNFVVWNSPHAVWRGVWDLLIAPDEGDDTLEIFEWKTGKIYDEHQGQSELYCVVGHCTYDIDCVRTTNVYLDQGENIERELTATDVKGVQLIWDERRRKIENDDIMAPNPGFYCRWCDFSKDRGGPCQF